MKQYALLAFLLVGCQSTSNEVVNISPDYTTKGVPDVQKLVCLEKTLNGLTKNLSEGMNYNELLEGLDYSEKMKDRPREMLDVLFALKPGQFVWCIENGKIISGTNPQIVGGTVPQTQFFVSKLKASPNGEAVAYFDLDTGSINPATGTSLKEKYIGLLYSKKRIFVNTPKSTPEKSFFFLTAIPIK
jgi:hypothetical protein